MGFLRLPKSISKSKKRAGAASGRKSQPEIPDRRAMDETHRTVCSHCSEDDGANSPLGERRSFSQVVAPLDECHHVAHDDSWDLEDTPSGCDDDDAHDADWDIEDVLRGHSDIVSAPIDGDAGWDVDPVVRRTPSNACREQRGLAGSLNSTTSLSSTSSTSSRVSFVDEERGLTPRHVVTEVHYRPRTTRREKSELYYRRKDFAVFEKEDLYEQIEAKIREMEGGATVDATDDAEIQELMARVQRLQ